MSPFPFISQSSEITGFFEKPEALTSLHVQLPKAPCHLLCRIPHNRERTWSFSPLHGGRPAKHLWGEATDKPSLKEEETVP